MNTVKDAERIKKLEARVADLYQALSTANLALWDIAAIEELMAAEGTIGESEFPDHIAGAVRMMGWRAREVVKITGEVA